MDTEQIETHGQDGRRVWVLKVKSRIDTSTFSGRGSIEGLPRYTLGDGSAVNVDGDGFEVVATGERLERA